MWIPWVLYPNSNKSWDVAVWLLERSTIPSTVSSRHCSLYPFRWFFSFPQVNLLQALADYSVEHSRGIFYWSLEFTLNSTFSLQYSDLQTLNALISSGFATPSTQLKVIQQALFVFPLPVQQPGNSLKTLRQSNCRLASFISYLLKIVVCYFGLFVGFTVIVIHFLVVLGGELT